MASQNLLLGFMPDALGLLIFGVGLIAFAASLRWIFSRREEAIKGEKFSAETHTTIG